MVKESAKVPFYKKWWFWAIIGVWFGSAAIVGIISGSKPKDENKPQEQAQVQEVPADEKIKKYIEDNYALIPDTVTINDSSTTLALWTKNGDVFTRNSVLREVCEPTAKYVHETVPGAKTILIYFHHKELNATSRCAYKVEGDSVTLDAEYWAPESE